MQRDIEYWQDADNITVEPKTVKGRTAMVEEFPIYSTAKLYKAYLSNHGAMRWEFPHDSSVLQAFLDSNFCSAAQVVVA